MRPRRRSARAGRARRPLRVRQHRRPPGVGRDPEQDPRKRHGASYVLLTLAVVAALVLVGLAGKALMGDSTPPAQTTPVPNVVDMTRDDAIAKLKEAGFTPVVSTRTDNSAKNTVFDQDPPAGERRPADAQVTIVVSSGPGQVELPDLRTFSEAAAREALRSQGLTVSDTKTVDDPDVDKGDVVRTSPAAHSTVAEGSSVVLEISSGKVEVPDVVDKDWSEAKTHPGRRRGCAPRPRSSRATSPRTPCWPRPAPATRSMSAR